MNRSQDWLFEAKGDLDHARKSVPIHDYNWACFAAQQAAEKALKALHLHRGAVACGHSVRELLEALEPAMAPSRELLEAGRRLDRHYIPSRYPNAHPAGAPRQAYGEADARQAVADAEKVVTWCDQNLPREP
ncbi:MAG: HEPN domain-containing protein [Planctomycetota bacterium]